MSIKHTINNIARATHINDAVFFFLKPFKSSIVDIDCNTARAELMEFSPKPGNSSIGNNAVSDDPRYDLQIIVPVYNVEKYLTECINSILNQDTEYSFKLCLVDDGSTDASGKMVDEYSGLDNIEIIHQRNKGVSSARNAALKRIDAKYVLFVDSDDTIPPNAIQNGLKYAFENDADYVEGWFKRQSGNVITADRKTNKTFRIHSSNQLNGFIWGAFIRNTVFEKIVFPVSTLYEDTNLAFLIFPMINTAYKIPCPTYVYRENQSSITHVYTAKPRSIETYWVTEQMIDDHNNINLPKDEAFFEQILQQIVCNHKRIKTLPLNIQRDIFALSCEIVDNNITSDVKKHRPLLSAMQKRDFGIYEWYCSTR